MLLQNCAYPRDDRVRREAKTLVEDGYQITIIAPSASGQPWTETINGVHVIRFPEPPSANGFLGYVWEYGYSMVAISILSFYVFIRYNFDVIHAHQPPDTFAIIAAFYKLFGKKYVFDHHDLAPELYYARFTGHGNSVVYKLLLLFEKWSCRLANHVIATNQSYKQIELERGNVQNVKITIVRNGPDLKELPQSLIDQELRRKAKIIIGYVGVMGIQDGVDNLIRALRYLIDKCGKTDFLCVLVGDGAAMPGLRKLVEELKLSDYVFFAGWVAGQQDIARYLNSMDICVAPEPSDPYNDRSTAAKIMEYMAFGKPIAAFNLPEHRYTAQSAAIYASVNNIPDLAEKISYLIDNPDLRAKFGEMGKARLMNELSWVQQEKALIEAYKAISSEK